MEKMDHPPAPIYITFRIRDSRWSLVVLHGRFQYPYIYHLQVFDNKHSDRSFDGFVKVNTVYVCIQHGKTQIKDINEWYPKLTRNLSHGCYEFGRSYV